MSEAREKPEKQETKLRPEQRREIIKRLAEEAGLERSAEEAGRHLREVRLSPEERERLLNELLEEARLEEEKKPTAKAKPKLPISEFAIIGLIVEVLALFAPVFLAIIIAPIGAAFGGVAVYQVRKNARSGAILAWTSLIFGIFLVVISTIIIVQTLAELG